jgi:hypothetical protein
MADDAYASLVSGSNASIFSGASSLLSGSSTSLISTDSVTFFKTVNVTGARGGVTPVYTLSTTLAATIKVYTQPTRVTEMTRGQARPESRTVFEIQTNEDPGVSLGSPVATNDLIVWGDLKLNAIGTAFPLNGKWQVNADLLA